MNDDIIDQAYAELDALRSRIPHLDEALVPGTPRRWMHQDLTPRQRRNRDIQARDDSDAKDENIVRGIVASGYCAAPLRTDVLDAQAAIAHGIATLEIEVCERFGFTPEAGGDVEIISRLVRLLTWISGDANMAGRVRNESRRLNRLAARALGESEPIHRLDARCPHCDAASLRALPDHELVVCVNGACRCKDPDCGCHRECPRRHQWTYDQWPKLAAILGAA